MSAKKSILFFTLFFCCHIYGQNHTTMWSPQREKIILPKTSKLLIDSLPVVLSSIVITDTRKNPIPLQYHIEGEKERYLIFTQETIDTLLLQYHVINIDLNKTYKNKDTTLIIPKITSLNPTLYKSTPSNFKPFEGLNSKGSISRSITVGNNQDAVLNSSLNLQLEGKLSSETTIRASITDNNLPVQADGYTQQLREFDRVYLEIENTDFGILRAGDFNITTTENPFLQFDKRISGAGIFSSVKAGSGEIPINLQGGIARGKFARNRFQGSEGNQGPYKLTGTYGERFVIIISGSERVYIDGVLMKRGQQYDYTIDYNAGEISFTALQPITKEKRIVVEFQYTEQNYLRSVAFASTGFESEKWTTKIQVYSEQDSKNQSLIQDLSDDEKQILSHVGDQIDQAYSSTIRSVSYQKDLVLYEMKDSLGYDSILVYSTDSTASLFQASFTYLGPNKGNYIEARNAANGRVFKWVPPDDNGNPTGSYEAVKLLIAPNKLQIITTQSVFNINNNQSISMDLAASKNDINLFSSLDKENDVGAAGSFKYLFTGKLGKNDWFGNVRYEFNQEKFKTVERLRNVEFARDWNLPLNYSGAVQLIGGSLGIKNDSSQIRYDVDHLNFTQYQGIKNTLNGKIISHKNLLRLNTSWLHSTDSLYSADFLRENISFKHYLSPKLWTGIHSVGEHNQKQNHTADTLNRNSYQFLEYQVFMGIGDTTESFVEINYLQRFDDTALDGRFQRYSIAQAYSIRSGLNTTFNSRLELFGNIRQLQRVIPAKQPVQTTISSRANYTQRLFKNAIISTTFFETGSGTEPRRTFSYVEVPAGTGTYAHFDYNKNGIQELDEFEISVNPDEAKYVRVFTPSTEYLRTSLNKFGQNLNINGPQSWQQKKGLLKSLSHFSILTNYQLDRKTLLEGNSNTLNPFNKVNDSSVVSLNNTFRNTLFFNRTATKYGADYTYRLTDSRNLLSFGIEQRLVAENSLAVRYQIIAPLLFRTQISTLKKDNISQNFTQRNFDIFQLENEYSLAFQPTDKLLFTLKYIWNNKEGKTNTENALLKAQDFGLELNYALAESFASLLQLNYIENNFNGESTNPAAYEMLEGLQAGKNGTWQLSLQKTIRKNILVSLHYNGRISEKNPVIQTGSLQVKAFF